MDPLYVLYIYFNYYYYYYYCYYFCTLLCVICYLECTLTPPHKWSLSIWQHHHAPDQGQGISSLGVIFQNKMDSSWPILFFYPIRTWIFRALSLSSTVMAVTCVKSFQMLIWPILLWIQACILCLVIVSTQQPIHTSLTSANTTIWNCVFKPTL